MQVKLQWATPDIDGQVAYQTLGSPWDVLKRSSPSVAPRRTKASQIRDLLKTGPQTAAAIAVATGISSAAVYQALKRDLRTGRIVLSDGRYRQNAGGCDD